MIKLVDQLSPMGNFAVAEAKDIVFADSESLQKKLDDGSLSGGSTAITVSQEEFDALDEQTKLENDYHCYDSGRLYYKGVRYGHDKPETIKGFSKYKEMKEAGLIDDEEEYLVEADENGILLEASDIGYSNAVSNLPCTTVQGAIDKVAEKVDGLIDDEDTTSTTSTLSASKIRSAVTYSFNTQDGKVKYLKLKLDLNTISVVDVYGGKIEILGANNSNANPDYKTVKVVRHSYGDWGSYDANQTPSALSTKIGSLYYYPTDNYYYLQLNNYANFTVTGALTKPEEVTELPVATSEMTLIPESAFASKDAFATTNKRVQGGTPFYEMYFAESRYRKLTVDLYYGREVTFSVNNFGYEGIISVYSNSDSASACVVKNIGVRGNPQGNISVKWGNYKALGGSGHYQVDLFIYKVNANNTMIIRPRTQQIDGYTKVYTSADFVASSQTEYEAAEYTAIIEYEGINDSSTGNAYSTWSSSKIANETAKKKQVMQLPFTISDNKFSVKYSDVLALIDKYCNFENSGVKQNAYIPFYLTCYTSNNNTLLSCFAKFEGGIYLDKVVYSSNDSSAEITRESEVNFISIELGGTITSLFIAF